MSVLDGPGEGTWSVFAAKVVEQRDEARAEVERLRGLLREAHRELSTIEAITVSPSDTDGLIALVKKIEEVL